MFFIELSPNWASKLCQAQGFIREPDHSARHAQKQESVVSQRAGCAGEGQANSLLHIATMSGMLACLLRHFRASLASLPLLGQPIGSLPLGTWAPETPQGRAALAEVRAK